MSIIKRIFPILLCGIFLLGTAACSSTAIYPVEKEINSYVLDMTKDGVQYTESPALKSYELYSEEKVLTVKLKQGLSSAPSFEITTGKNNKKTVEKEILSIYATKDGETSLYGSATALSRYFDPYRNDYVPCMRVYKMDENHFRALFFISNSQKQDDFFPFYLALTEEGYNKAISGIRDYVEVLERSFSSYEDGAAIPDYESEFKSMFIPVKGNSEAVNAMYGDKFSALDSSCYVLYQLGGNYPTIMDEILPKYAGIDMQYMRNEYEKLGYVGYDLDIIIVTADIVVSQDGSSADITMNDNVFYSDAALASGAEYRFEFCPSLTGSGEEG